jgi:putative ABC transport system permease protein
MLHDFPSKPPALPTALDHLLVVPKSLPDHEACKHQVKRTLGRLHNFDPLDKEASPVWDTVENAKAFEKLMDAMKYFLGAIGITTLLLGGLGVMNVMLVAVRERTREIGVRRAVGATRHNIVVQFLVYAIVISLIGGILGLAVGIAGAYLGGSALSVTPVFSATTVSLALAVAAAVGILAGIGPAVQAASVEPTTALRYE